MPKRTSTLAQSKRHENRVSRYLFGKDRDWKEQWDVSGQGWIGEVKCRANLSFAEGCRLVREAFDQLREATKELGPFQSLFVVIHTKRCSLSGDAVFLAGGRFLPVMGPQTLEEFREHLTAEEEVD